VLAVGHPLGRGRETPHPHQPEFGKEKSSGGGEGSGLGYSFPGYPGHNGYNGVGVLFRGATVSRAGAEEEERPQT